MDTSKRRTCIALQRKAGDYAVSMGLVGRNVCDGVSFPRIEKYEVRSLTLEQVRQLLEAARGHRVEALWVLALVTGMRRGELLGLKWSDINLSEGVISVQCSLVDVK
ncbi:MAG: site-specific integrase, partial [Chloroflexi bacterium]